MKKLFTLGCFICLATISNYAQTVIINTGTAGTPAYNAGPIYRSSAASAYDASRYCYLYTASELAAAGITSGSVISLVGWAKNNTATTTGGGIFRIYMKNTSTASFSLASETWANLNSGATMVYENLSQTIPATTQPTYIDFPLTTNFTYTGGSLEIATEWDINGVAGNPTTGTFDWLWSTVVDRIYGTGNTTLAPITTLSSTTNSISTIDDRRPFIKITYSGGTTGIDVGAQSLVTPAATPNNCYTSSEIVTIQIRNYSTNPIDFSINPVTVTTNVTGAVTQTLSATVNTGTLAASATLNVPMSGTLNMNATGVYTFNASAIVAGDVIPSNDAMAPVNITKAVLSAGTASASPPSYCVTPGAPTLSTTGATGYATLQWQQSVTSGSGFSDIPGATTSPYTVGSPISQTMYYRLQATCNGNTVTSNEVTVTLNNPQITSTTPGASCGPGPVTVSLAATGTGAVLNWYSAASGGTPIGTGSPFTTPPINSNTTYYVSSGSGSGSANVGLPAQLAGTSGAGTTNFGLVFDALAPFTLNTVVIYPIAASANTAGTVTIDVISSAGVVLNTATVPVIGNPVASATAQTVTLNFSVAAGTNLKLRPGSRSAGITGLLFEPSATAPPSGNYGYPFTIPGVLSITASTLTAAPTNTPRLDLYYYFYNWSVSTGCESPRTAVLATVTTPPSATISYGGSPYCSNAGTATVTQTGTTGGTYSSTPGLTINPTTGDVTLGTSTAGTYTVTYTIPASGGCSQFTTTASITIQTAASATISYAGSPYCVNGGTATVTRTGTAGGTFSSTAGLSINASTGDVTLGTSTPGTYTVTYTIAASGPCPVFTTTASITINLNNTITLSSAAGTDAQTVCINAPIANITYNTTGATGATFSGLPAGVNGNWAANVVTISGTPSASGVFNYIVTLTGGCGSGITANGTITVNPNNTITLTSAAGTNAQTVCVNSPITNITYSTTGATGASFSGLPSGVNGNWAANVVTINGTPTATGTFNYTVSLTGGCGVATANGSITVNPLPSIGAILTQPTTCLSADGAIDITPSGTPGPYGYFWTTSGGSGLNPTAQDQTGLTIGQYTVVVTDQTTGCQQTAVYNLTGPGGCGSCPIIGSVTTIPTPGACANATVTFTASGLVNMGTNYGIIFKYAPNTAPLADPYTGGTVIGTVPNGSLGGGGTTATLNGSIPTGGNYIVYAILSPTPVDPSCRPSQSVGLVINPTPNVNAIANQTVCNGGTTTTVNFTGPVLGTAYSWTNSNTSIGLAASGTNAPAVINPVSAVSTMGAGFGTLLANTINGVGLSNFPSLMATHTLTTPANSWVSTAGTLAGSITFNLGGTYDVNGFAFWNQNGGGPGALGSTGIKDVQVQSSLDGVTFFPVAGAPATFSQIPGNGNLAPETFSFAPVSAAYIRFVVANNYGDAAQTGFAEVAFSKAGSIPAFVATNSGNSPAVATVTVTPSYNNAGANCPGTPTTFTYTVNPTATVTAVSNQTVCNGASTTAVNFSSPTTGGTIVYNWTNNTPSIGLAASGTGNIASFVATNATNAPVTATITVTPTYTNNSVSCVGTPTTFTITVNPTPNAVATPSTQTICSNTAMTTIVLSGSVAGTTFNWTRDNTVNVTGIPNSGSGNISGTPINNTTTPQTVNFTITPTANGCPGTPITATMTVNPTPTVNPVSNQTVCNGSPTAPVTFSGPVAGTSFAWTNNTPSIGLAASGSGNIASFIATNAGTTPVTATVTVTPSTGLTGGGATVAVTGFVNNNANATILFNFRNNNAYPVTITGIESICSTAGLKDVSALYKTSAINGLPGALNAGNGWNQFGAAVINGIANTTTTTTQPFMTTLSLVVPAGATYGICVQAVNQGTTTAAQRYSTIAAGTYTFSAGGCDIITGTNIGYGGVAIPGAPTFTPRGFMGKVTFSAPPPGGPVCSGPSTTFTYTVNPTPTGTATPSTQTICSGTPMTTIVLNGPVAGTTFNWTRNNTVNVTGVPNSGSGDISGTPVNNTPGQQTVIYTITPTANGCNGTPFTATVIINKAPTIVCPANVTVNNTPGQCGANVTLPAPTVTGSPAPTVTFVPASGSFFPVGTTTVTATATNTCGSASCTFTVTVLDVQSPTITCPTSITTPTNPGVCTATIAVPNPTVGDNCGVTTVTWVMTGATTGSSPATGINYLGTQTFNLNGTTGQGVTTIVYTVKDAAGNTTTCSFTVTVNDAAIPVITGQPVNRTVCPGLDATFSVTASVPAGNPLTYQWQAWNGSAWVNISGATASTLTISAVNSSMNTNSYRVILTGRCSVVTSNFATLYVYPVPSVIIVASMPPILLPGQTLTLTAVVSPPGGTFAWKKNGVTIAGATGSTLTGLTVNDIGTYQVTYTDPNGCVAVSATLTVSGLPTTTFYVYPNPNSGQFQIRFYNQPNENVTVKVFDSKGGLVYQRTHGTTVPYSNIDVNLSRLPQGSYLVQVLNSSGGIVGAKWIIVYRY